MSGEQWARTEINPPLLNGSIPFSSLIVDKLALLLITDTFLYKSASQRLLPGPAASAFRFSGDANSPTLSQPSRIRNRFWEAQRHSNEP